MYIKKFAGRCSSAQSCDDTGTMVAAGAADTRPCCGCIGQSPAPAIIYFPDQDYVRGFCPSDALCSGTLFPELVM